MTLVAERFTDWLVFYKIRSLLPTFEAASERPANQP
jgi:hypothetical protein